MDNAFNARDRARDGRLTRPSRRQREALTVPNCRRGPYPVVDTQFNSPLSGLIHEGDEECDDRTRVPPDEFAMPGILTENHCSCPATATERSFGTVFTPPPMRRGAP